MSNWISTKVKNPTYRYKSPVIFQGKAYFDSKELVEAFLNNWDDGITSFKCGEWEDFWDTSVELEASVKAENKRAFRTIGYHMWEVDHDSNIDVLFTKVLHYFEPALEEIPYFMPGTSQVQLWSGEQFKQLFQRELKKTEISYLTNLQFDNLGEDWSRTYDTAEREILYVCRMLKEKIFTLFGYAEAEDSFLKVAFSDAERQNGMGEYLVRAYQGVGDRLYERDEFVYQGKVCHSLEEFGALWKDSCAGWSIKEWDAFIETLYEEKEGVCSFPQWLSGLQEQELLRCFNDWKEEAKEWRRRSGGSKRNELPEEFPENKPIAWGEYLKYGGQKWHDTLVDAYEKEVEKLPDFIKKQSKRTQVETLKDLYLRMFGYLKEAIKGLPEYDSYAIKAELEGAIERWKEWEKSNQKAYEDKKMLVNAMRNHKVLSCWNHGFSHPLWEQSDNGQCLALLACAPIEESFQKDCEAFLQLMEAGTIDCAPEKVKGYAEAIFEFIYRPLVDKSEKPDKTIKETLDKMIEGYFRLLESLSTKLPATIHLSNIISGEGYKRRLLLNHQLHGITLEMEHFLRLAEDTMEKKQKEIKELSPERRSVDYTPFYKNNEVYIKWRVQKRKTDEIQKEWVTRSKEIANLAEEWEAYINENYDKKSIDKLYEAGKAKLAVSREHHSVLVEKEKEWKQAVYAANRQWDILMKARRQYEEEWDKQKKEEEEARRQEKIKEAKRKAFAENVKKTLLVLAALVLLISVIGVTLGGIKKKFFTAWKVEDGILTANLDEDSLFFKKDKFLDRVADVLTDTNQLVLPEGAEKIGNVGIRHTENYAGNTIHKLVLPEGATEITSDFSAEGMSQLTEINFPASMETISGNFNGTGLKNLYAENVTAISGTASFGSVFNGTQCYAGAFARNSSLSSVNLPSLQNLEDYAFCDCNALTEVNLPLVQVVGQHAFENCYRLSNVTLPSATELNYYVFLNCTYLTTVNLPSAKTVCLSSFYGCENLQEVYLPTVETVYFNKTLNKGKIYIGSSVQRIDFQVVPTRMENGSFENIHEKHQIEIVLDAGGTYSREVLTMLDTVASNPEEYGEVKISHADFAELGMK